MRQFCRYWFINISKVSFVEIRNFNSHLNLKEKLVLQIKFHQLSKNNNNYVRVFIKHARYIHLVYFTGILNIVYREYYASSC